MSADKLAMPGRVSTELADGIAWVTFDSPQRRNALSLAMWEELRRTMTRLDQDPQVRVVVIRGAGRTAFTSGADISEFAQVRSNAEQKAAYSLVSGGAQQSLWALDKPLIAMVHGF